MEEGRGRREEEGGGVCKMGVNGVRGGGGGGEREKKYWPGKIKMQERQENYLRTPVWNLYRVSTGVIKDVAPPGELTLTTRTNYR